MYQKILISQNETGKIRIFKEEYTSIQTRFIVENEKYFNSHKNFYPALAEFNKIAGYPDNQKIFGGKK